MIKFLYAILLLLTLCNCRKKTDVGEGVIPPISINDQVETKPHTLIAVTKPINGAVGGFYVGLPSLYNQTTKNYPFILFLPGGGQAGNGASDLSLLLLDGVVKLIDAKTFPPNFLVNGKNYSFIVLTPQFIQTPTAEELLSVIDYAKKNYRIDTTRFYLSGLSFGSILSTEIAFLDPSKYAALVTIAGTFSDTLLTAKCQRIAAANLPVWSFHNSDDPVIPASVSIDFFNGLSSFKPPVPPRLTIFKADVHDAWTQATNPLYKENDMNMYEFMLKYSR